MEPTSSARTDSPTTEGGVSAPQGKIPTTLVQPGAGNFWLTVIGTGIGAGLSAAFLTLLLTTIQHWVWPPADAGLLAAATHASPWHHVWVLMVAGLMVGGAHFLWGALSSANGIEITTAIWFTAGRLPPLRTLSSALISIVIVALGASLGREGAPKQAGAVIANALADRRRLSDEQRRLLVACGAGAGMAAAYDVPLGGALFALEVLRGALALRLVLPALGASLIATLVAWLVIPDRATYAVPHYGSSLSSIAWALLAGPVAGVVSVAYVRLIALADRHRPRGWQSLLVPTLTLALLGAASIPFPQLLGNGKDVTQLAFLGQLAPGLVLTLLVLRPLASAACLGSGAPGGLFTPTLTLGALLGGALGYLWTWLWPGIPPGLCALIGAGAVLAATTQGPISAVVLMIELTGRDRTFLVPLLVAVATSTLVSRTIDPRSIYDARLTDEELAERQRLRDPPSH
jgi:chloride channel protein, CIC family